VTLPFQGQQLPQQNAMLERQQREKAMLEAEEQRQIQMALQEAEEKEVQKAIRQADREERRKREEICASFINIAKQMGGSLGLHLISGGVGLPLHLPFILWQVYQLLKNLKRRMKLRSVALKRDLKLKKIGLRNIAISTTIALVSPGLARLGARGVNEFIIDLYGGPIRPVSVKVPNILQGSGPIDGVQVQDIYLADTDSLPQDSFCLADQLGQDMVDNALDKLKEKLSKEPEDPEGEPPEGFTDLVQALLDGIPTGGILLSNRFTFHCDRCSKKLQDNWFSCPVCDDYDLCTDCFTRNDYTHRHELAFAKQAEISDEIDELRRLLTSIQDGALTIAEPRGAFAFCDGCRLRIENRIYYTCKQCEDFDLCRSCLIDPTKRGEHKSHDFVPVKAAPQTPETSLPPSPTIHPTRTPVKKITISSYTDYEICCDVCKTLITSTIWTRCSELSCKDLDLHEHCSKTDIGPHNRWHPLVLVSLDNR